MTYFMDFIQNLTKKGNTGVLIYLILNVFIVVTIFSMVQPGITGTIFGIVAYALSIAIALSPAGEWLLRVQTGCKRIKRVEYKERLEPLFREVYDKAKEQYPLLSENIELFMSQDKFPNAFATGRKTVCLTKGFLGFSDNKIKAVFAHELGHLAHKDTDIILIIAVGNFIVSAFFITYRVITGMMAFMFAIASRSYGTLIMHFFMDLIFVGMMWLWTRFGIILTRHSSRQNEYLADKFAYDCGYGNELAETLDLIGQGSGAKGLWANLASTHPDTDDRIARLQDLGCSYRAK